MMKDWQHRISSNIACGLAMAVAAILAMLIAGILFPFMGYGAFLLFYLMPAAGLLAFYYLMSEFSIIPSLISFAISSVVWIAEINKLVVIADSLLSRSSNLWLLVWLIGALLASVNKLLVDAVFLQLGLPLKETELNRLMNK
jgi:hypothetical protein